MNGFGIASNLVRKFNLEPKRIVIGDTEYKYYLLPYGWSGKYKLKVGGTMYTVDFNEELDLVFTDAPDELVVSIIKILLDLDGSVCGSVMSRPVKDKVVLWDFHSYNVYYTSSSV